METPFNFENQPGEGDPPRKNQFSDEEAAAKAIQELDKDIQALLSSAKQMLDDRDRVTHDKEGNQVVDERKVYSPEDPATAHRRDLVSIVAGSPEATNRLDQTSPKDKQAIKDILRAALDSQANVFSVSGDRDHTEDFLKQPEIDPPYTLTSTLYKDLQNRFEENFWRELNLLDMIPRKIVLAESGAIREAEFSLRIDKEELSKKFKECFPASDFFRLFYEFAHEPSGHDLQYNYFAVKGFTRPDIFLHEEELKPPGSVA